MSYSAGLLFSRLQFRPEFVHPQWAAYSGRSTPYWEWRVNLPRSRSISQNAISVYRITAPDGLPVAALSILAYVAIRHFTISILWRCQVCRFTMSPHLPDFHFAFPTALSYLRVYHLQHISSLVGNFTNFAILAPFGLTIFA